MSEKRKIVFLSGAGVSAESGLKTFRDENGLWEGHDVMEVATPEAWRKNPELVLEFYNQRRRQLKDVEPNIAHKIIAELETSFEVHVITQNVDDLHERAGSTNVLHLHGKLFKVRPEDDLDGVIEWYDDLNLGHTTKDGVQLRPHVVWFGEGVPNMAQAIDIVANADIVVVIGTSLQVYPAAGLMNYAKADSPIYLIDPKPGLSESGNLYIFAEPATIGMQKLKSVLLEN